MQRMPKRPRRNAQFWASVYAAIERFPAAFPVTVIVGKDAIPVEQRPSWAVSDKIGNQFFIWMEEPQIDLPPLAPDHMDVRQTWLWDCFLHEYAHLLDWSHLHDTHDVPYAQKHGATWGVWYAKLYQSLMADP